MYKTITFLLLLTFTTALSQQLSSGEPGNYFNYKDVNGQTMVQSVTGVQQYKYAYTKNTEQENQIFASSVRWYLEDAVAIADRCKTSGNGLYQAVGYGLNVERVAVYGNTNSTPIWEYNTDPNTFTNYVAISDNGNYIAAGSYHNIYIWNRSSSTPVVNYDLTTLPSVGVANAIDITSNGNYIIATSSVSVADDSSFVMLFSNSSPSPLYKLRIGKGTGTGPGIQGIRFSGNDSLFIVNTYSDAYVFYTYTGQLRWTGPVNPGSASGTQFPQGISGNGNIIAMVNYSGKVRVMQWNGTTYNQLWEYQESGAWMCGNDVSDDGTMVAAGTLNFLGGSSYDGKVRIWKVANGNIPLWTYTGMGDEVQDLDISANGNILAASSWGDYGTNLVNDLVVFKTWSSTPTPFFSLNGIGSFFSTSVSNDGSTVIASGKRVHARAFGNGAEVYNVFIDTNDVVGITSNGSPVDFTLSQNYPNPFNPNTMIGYKLAKTGSVKLIVTDIIGREVETLVDKKQDRGRFEVEFNALGLTSGIYFYTLYIDGLRIDTKKMIMVK